MLSPLNRINGMWRVVSLVVDGVDSTEYYQKKCNCYLNILLKQIQQNDKYVEQGNFELWFCHNPFMNNGNGTIDFGNKNVYDNLYLGYKDRIYPYLPISNQSVWKISRLNAGQFWITTTLNNKNYEIKFMLN